jgi:hypothetical protein
MSGIDQSTVKVTLRNPLDHNDLLDYYIIPNDTKLAKDWVQALAHLLESGNLLEKNFCFIGFPKSARTLEYLCGELNSAIETINLFNFTQFGLENYVIEEWFHPNTVRFPDTYPIESTVSSDQPHPNVMQLGLHPKHLVLNRLHNHFEQLQGTVSNLSKYYQVADYNTKYAIRQLNVICHEIESLILSQKKEVVNPEWIRPTQITTFLHAKRYQLEDIHRHGFITNGYDRRFGYVYMHWAQIGKTLFEVWRDEGGPELTDTICEAITHLEYYSGEFDIEWAKSVTLADNFPWHDKEQREFKDWLIRNNLNPHDIKLSLGYLELGHIDCIRSFGTTNMGKIREQLSTYLDIYSIEVNGIKNTFDYCWTDDDYKQKQIDKMKPGYDFSSRG